MILRHLFSLVLSISIVTAWQFPLSQTLPKSTSPQFTLRHSVHLSNNRTLPALHKQHSSSPPTSSILPYSVDSIPSIQLVETPIWKPNSQLAYDAFRRLSHSHPHLLTKAEGDGLWRLKLELWLKRRLELAMSLEWGEVKVPSPNTSDVETVRALAMMTGNAYSLPESGGWYDLEGKWNVSDSFGWLEHGIRGHVFANEDNSTVIISIKGTSSAVPGGGGGPTGTSDKLNDNLFFSCCCARVDWTWRTVCDCYDGGYTCKQDCIEEAIMNDSSYYPMATDLYNNITALYPNSNIILAGHSLGGALSGLLALTFGVPAVTFEAPGDMLPARRLHLPIPPLGSFDSVLTVLSANNPSATLLSSSSFSANNRTIPQSLLTLLAVSPLSSLSLNPTSFHIPTTVHIYHTADPIAMGVCTGSTSTCALAGFAMESKCHTGVSRVYDTVGILGWSVDIRTHRIVNVIENLLKEEWGVKDEIVGGGHRKKGGRVKGWGWWPGSGKKKEGDGEGEEEEEDDGQHGGRGVPDAEAESDCVDCFRWEYVDG